MRNPSPFKVDTGTTVMDRHVGAHCQGPVTMIARGGKNHRYGIMFFTISMIICGLSAFIGIAAPLGNFAHDTFFLLGNAYRIVQGQVPSRDFSSPWGPVIFLIEGAGLLLSGLRPAGIGYANAVFGLLIASWAFLTARRRSSPANACLIGVYTLLLISAPFPLGMNPLDFGYAMIYNRYGYAILGIIVMECIACGQMPGHDSRFNMIGPLSTGTAFGLLMYLKISYAIISFPFIALSIVGTNFRITQRILALWAGFMILNLCILSYMRFDLVDMWRDLAMAARSRSISLQIIHPMSLDDLLGIASIVYIAFSLYRYRAGSSRPTLQQVRYVGFALFTVAAGYLLLISNQQMSSFPLNAYGAIALSAAYVEMENDRLPATSQPSSRLVQSLLLVFCFLPVYLTSTISLADASLLRQWPQLAPGVELSSPEQGVSLAFRRITGPKRTEISGADYVKAVQNGLSLIRRFVPDNRGVLVFDEFNPFNYLLNRPSPRGGMAASAYDYIFCAAAHPAPERFFGNASYVMVRKYNDPLDFVERTDVHELVKFYGPELQSDFSKLAETRHWTLWRRKHSLSRALRSALVSAKITRTPEQQNR